MFSSLFFIFLILALINFIPDLPTAAWITSPDLAWEVGFIFYIFLLGLLFLQLKGFASFTRLSSSLILIIINLELIAFLLFYYFGLGGHRFLLEGFFANFQTPFSLYSLILYAFGLGWAHYWMVYFHLTTTPYSYVEYAFRQLQFLFPFCLPFLLFTILFDGLELIPAWKELTDQYEHNMYYQVGLLILSLIFLGIMFAFMPSLIILTWHCRPLQNRSLENHLQAVCHQAHFKHAGFKVWNVLKHSFTAGIIGIIPRFRYIMFTPSLLREFSTEEIEAILIHEIGHSYYRHLLIYPFILMGMLVLAAFGAYFYTDPIAAYFDHLHQHYPSEGWSFLFSLTLFMLYALILGLYFRFIFGFYSRLFERQADLHIFNFHLPSSYMIQALDHIAILTGHTHNQPSWHHHSIQERIDFLKAAIAHPSLVKQHHRMVKRWVYIYFIVLICSCLIFYYLF